MFFSLGDGDIPGGVQRLRADAESLRQKLETATFTTNANSKHLVETAALIPAQTDSETPTRKELGKLFNVSQEAIRIWEENGKLKELGWERIPHKQNPVRYRRKST